MNPVSKPQLRASLWLSMAIFLTLLINSLYTRYRLSLGFQDADPVEDARILDSLLAQIPKDEVLVSFARFEEKSVDEPNPKTEALHLHSFNPNTIGREEWKSMGLPERVFNGLEKYRMKGGRIRRPEQVFRLYNLSPEVAQQMVPFLRIDTAPFQRNSFSERKLTQPAYPKRIPKPLFDLNQADTIQLKEVFGIGSKTASRILKYREGLGGFIRKDQVYEIFGLDSTVVEELLRKSFLNEGAPLRKLKINEISEEDLASHPYVRKLMARVIIRYRNQHGRFHSEADLLKIRILPADLLPKIRPYLEF